VDTIRGRDQALTGNPKEKRQEALTYKRGKGPSFDKKKKEKSHRAIAGGELGARLSPFFAWGLLGSIKSFPVGDAANGMKKSE